MSEETGWYEEWFNSPLYEKMYKHRDQQEAQQMAQLIVDHFPPDQYPALLDLGCGRGRHSISLAKWGYRVTGIDLSPEAIARAKESARAMPEAEVTFHVGDMRKPLDKQFDLIANLFTTFGYFESDDENREVLRNIDRMCHRGSGVVIDFLSAPYVKAHLKPAEEGTEAGMRYEISRYIADGAVHKKMTFTLNDNTRRTFTERVKLYPKSWFEEELRALGLNVNSCFGDYDGSPYQGEESPRLILMAEKSGE